MISFLEGEVEHKGATSVVLAVGGVGYDVSVPTSVVSRLPAVGNPRACTPAWSCVTIR